MCGKVHLAKGALSDQPAEGVVADRREVVGRELAAERHGRQHGDKSPAAKGQEGERTLTIVDRNWQARHWLHQHFRHGPCRLDRAQQATGSREISPLPCVHEHRRTSPLPAASLASRAARSRLFQGRGFENARDEELDGAGVEGQYVKLTATTPASTAVVPQRLGVPRRTAGRAIRRRELNGMPARRSVVDSGLVVQAMTRRQVGRRALLAMAVVLERWDWKR